MNLLELAERNGDKPKKLPTRPPMWMQGATAPSASTATPSVYTTGVALPNVKKEVVITPKVKNYGQGGNPYSPLPLDKEFGLRTAGGLLPGVGEGIDVYDLQNSVRQGDPLGAGLSLLSLALPFVGGLSKYGNRVRNMFNFDDIVPQAKGIEFSDGYNALLKDKAATNHIINSMPIGSNPYDFNSAWEARDAIRSINGIDNSFTPTPTNLVPATMPNREAITHLINSRNDVKRDFIDAIEQSRSRPYNGSPNALNLPDVSRVNGIFGDVLRNTDPNYASVRGDFLRHYTPEVQDVVKNTFGMRGRSPGSFPPNFLEEHTWNLYRSMFNLSDDAPLDAWFGLTNDANRNILSYGGDFESNIKEMRRARQNMRTLAGSDDMIPNPPDVITLDWSSPSIPAPSVRNGQVSGIRDVRGVSGMKSNFPRTPENDFANEYARLFNENLQQRGIQDHFITANLGPWGLGAYVNKTDGTQVGSWSTTLNNLAYKKIQDQDWSIPEFPHNSANPYDDIPVMAMSNTSGANLPPKAGLYSQEFMNAIKNRFGIRVGAGRNSQTKTEDYIARGRPNLIGSEDIWKLKVDKGKAHQGQPSSPFYPFANTISYGVLGPMLYRALQKERNER